jgi:zinc transport system substrate-binding protein
MLLAVGALALHGCERPRAPTGNDAIRIVATIPPLGGLARSLAPPGARVVTLIAPGMSEHGYELTPSDLAELVAADVVVYVGLDLDPRIARFLNDHPSPRRRAVCFADVVGIVAAPEHHHDEGESREHDGAEHEGEGKAHEDADDDGHHHAVDPHLWLDPALVEKLVPAIGAAIEEAERSKGTSAGEANASETSTRTRDVAARVHALDAELAATLAPLKGQAIVTHHNAWGRFAARYGLRVAAVIRTIEGQEPTPDAIARSVEAVKAQGARGIFVEPQFNPVAAEAIARASGARLGVLDPIGTGDWFDLMRTNAKSLVRTLGEKPGGT